MAKTLGVSKSAVHKQLKIAASKDYLKSNKLELSEKGKKELEKFFPVSEFEGSL